MADEEGNYYEHRIKGMEELTKAIKDLVERLDKMYSIVEGK